MAFYPNQNPGNGGQYGQQPWHYNVPPSQSPQQPQQFQQSYGSPATYPAVPYPQTASQQWSNTPQQMPHRPALLALFAFPFLSLKMYLLPSPASFAKEQDRVGWSTLWMLLLVFTVVVGAMTWAWGRLPRLTQGISLLTLGHVTPQPLSIGVCIALAVAAPLVLLLVVAFMHWVAKQMGGKGTYRAQCYTVLLVGMVPLLVIAVLFFALNSNPLLGNSQRLIFAAVVIAIVLYSFLLHILAVMGVQQLGFGKAFVAAVSVLIVVVILALLVMAPDGIFDSSSSQGGANSYSTNAGRRRWRSRYQP